ncbi:ribonuclease P protein subunit [Nitrosopumilus sp. K4]|uniref:ribonuclease P protein component 1 n=1 Tax=Nitrosopumilus sp. K4 TaxID=2795383 RepID=UPI001BA86687|nr:ribonuclease P protein subunit [Nitrosopumilus sp. K4]QUC65387.1 ribonuclease P protein subunit [Nitrosopumilus sp. K4]
MITSENITSHELIGMNTEVTNSSNPQIIGLNGRIVDETKSMIRINTVNGIKSIAKTSSDFKFNIDSKEIIVKGSNIAKRSFDRLGGKA